MFQTVYEFVANCFSNGIKTGSYDNPRVKFRDGHEFFFFMSYVKRTRSRVRSVRNGARIGFCTEKFILKSIPNNIHYLQNNLTQQIPKYCTMLTT